MHERKQTRLAIYIRTQPNHTAKHNAFKLVLVKQQQKITALYRVLCLSLCGRVVMTSNSLAITPQYSFSR